MNRPDGLEPNRAGAEPDALRQKVRAKHDAKKTRQSAVRARTPVTKLMEGSASAVSGNGQALLDERQRREMIATAAFLRAQRRGFESGAELEDWLAAEEEIDRWLKVVDRGSEEPPLFEE